jgi:hypothetical protein
VCATHGLRSRAMPSGVVRLAEGFLSFLADFFLELIAMLIWTWILPEHVDNSKLRISELRPELMPDDNDVESRLRLWGVLDRKDNAGRCPE